MEHDHDNLVNVCFGENTADVIYNQVIVKSELTDDLELIVFFNSYYGFNSTSTLICGERDAILVSATFLISDAHKLVAGIMETENNLTHIIIPEFTMTNHKAKTHPPLIFLFIFFRFFSSGETSCLTSVSFVEFSFCSIIFLLFEWQNFTHDQVL